MSQRAITATYTLYRKYIDEKRYDLARHIYEHYLADVKVSALKLAIADYVIGE